MRAGRECVGEFVERERGFGADDSAAVGPQPMDVEILVIGGREARPSIDTAPHPLKDAGRDVVVEEWRGCRASKRRGA
jgi:hypothetical protein